jgi:hypothetical protein
MYVMLTRHKYPKSLKITFDPLLYSLVYHNNNTSQLTNRHESHETISECDGRQAVSAQGYAVGQVTTMAGGEKGHENGKANDAKFNNLVSIAVCFRGDMYIVDRYNHCIR